MPSIMVVDDEPEIVSLLTFIFEAEGYTVSSAEHGADALAKLGVEPAEHGRAIPDLIVLDIMMPVMDGYQLNMRLQTEARTKDIPILVLTAKGQKMRDLFEMAPNVAAYVQKPFDPKMLRELISGILSSRKQTHG
jgi:CheY-like chemotaxis protein